MSCRRNFRICFYNIKSISFLSQFKKIRWIGLGCSLILRAYPVFLKVGTHLKIEIRTGRGYFHGTFKCNQEAHCVDVMDSVLRYGWTLNAVRLLRPSPIHLSCKSTTLEKQQLVVLTQDNTFTKIVKKWFFKESSGAIIIGMRCLLFILSSFEMRHLKVPDLRFMFLFYRVSS